MTEHPELPGADGGRSVILPDAARLRRVSNAFVLVAAILLGISVVVTFSLLYFPAGFASVGEAQRLVPVFMVTQTLTTFIPPVAAATLSIGIVLRALTVRVEARRTASLILALAGALLVIGGIVLVVIGPNLALWVFPAHPLGYMITERVAAILRQILPAVAAGALLAGAALIFLQPKSEGTQRTPTA